MHDFLVWCPDCERAVAPTVVVTSPVDGLECRGEDHVVFARASTPPSEPMDFEDVIACPEPLPPGANAHSYFVTMTPMITV